MGNTDSFFECESRSGKRVRSDSADESVSKTSQKLYLKSSKLEEGSTASKAAVKTVLSNRPNNKPSKKLFHMCQVNCAL